MLQMMDIPGSSAKPFDERLHRGQRIIGKGVLEERDGAPERRVRADDLPHRSRRARRHLLWQPLDPDPGLTEDSTLVRLDFAGYQTKKGGFPRTIATEDADAFPGLEMEFGLVEQWRQYRRIGEVSKTNDGHGRTIVSFPASAVS